MLHEILLNAAAITGVKKAGVRWRIFYRLASVDYKHLAEAIDWRHWLETRQKEAGSRSLQLLDVACGSGKFPKALASLLLVPSGL